MAWDTRSGLKQQVFIIRAAIAPLLEWPGMPVRDCAPCHASQYPWQSQEELGETFLGHLIYLTSKDKGESSI